MNTFKEIGFWIAGWALVGFGILGLFVPVLQGILFIMIGLAILSSRSKMVKRFLGYVEKRYPHQYNHMVTWRDKIKHWFKTD
jgi:uncharacterized membrane protein YbaN (DUF454 family)